MKNNYAFIDGQNLHFGIKSLGWKLDHKKFREYLEKEHDVTKAFIFLGFMEEHQDLYNVLQDAGFICHFKPLVRYDDGTIKGNVDADMVLQIMVEYDNYDQAVMVSGDGDFSGLLRHLATRNKLGQMIIPNREKYSSLFDRIEGFDDKHVTYMNDLRDKLNYYTPGKQQQRTQRKKPQQQNEQKQSQPKQEKKADLQKAKPKPTEKKSMNKPQQKSSKPNNQRPRRSSNQKSNSSKPEKRFKSKSDLEKSLLEAIDNV